MVDPINRFLPEFCWRDQPLDVDGAVIHYISVRPEHPDLNEESIAGRYDVDTIFNFLVELNRPGPERGPIFKKSDEGRGWGSYHYLISRSGDVFCLVPPDRQAYHAGRSELGGRTDLNRWTLGIALAGDGEDEFDGAQYVSCAELLVNHKLEMSNVSGHEDVAVPEGRRKDPGPKFDWHRLAEILEKADD